MSTPIGLVVTQAGLTATLQAQQHGLQVHITHMALGSGGWAPDETATQLVHEEQRVPIAQGQVIEPDMLHISTVVDGPEAYWIREFGLLTDAGVLLAVWSDPVQPLDYKASQVRVVFNHYLILRAFPPGAITVANLTTNLHLTVAGELAQLATAIIAAEHRELRDLAERSALATRIAALEALH